MVRSSRPLNIWLVTVGEPLPGYSTGDRLWRCGFLARLLADRGHMVTWWTSTFDHFNKRHFEDTEVVREVGQNLRLRFLKGRAYARNVSISRLLNHRELGYRFTALANRARSPDVITVSYPPIELCEAVVAYGQREGIPVFADIRDLWPDEIVLRAPPWARGFARLLTWSLRQQAIEAVKKSSGLIAISDAYLRWGLKMAGRDMRATDQVIPLGYTGQVTPDQCPDDVLDRLEVCGVDPEKRIFWFCGTFVGNIDLKTVIDAARILSDRHELQFVLTGDGERAAEWRGYAGNQPNVVFTGWLGAGEIAGMSALAYAGLAAYKPCASMSLPNKLFEYMSAGLPVVSCLSGEAANIIEECDIGLSYLAGNADDLVEKVVRLAGDVNMRARQSASASALFEQKYSAQVVYKRYADFIESAAIGFKTHL